MTGNPDKNLEIVQRNYEAFAKGEFEAVLSNLSPDVEWITPEGDALFGGVKKGPEAVGSFFGQLGETYESFAIVPELLQAFDDKVIMIGTLNVTGKNGVSVEARIAHVSTVGPDGLVTRFEAIGDTALIAKAQ